MIWQRAPHRGGNSHSSLSEWPHTIFSNTKGPVFLLDGDSEDHGLPVKALINREYGARQDAFLTRVKEAGLTLQHFRNPDDLKGQVERSLRELANSPKAIS